MSKIILFDIDYTLFDTTKFKQIIAKKLSKFVNVDIDSFYFLLEEVYYASRFQNHFEPSLFPQAIREKVKINLTDKELELLWFDPDLIRDALYPETLSVLKSLQNKNIAIGIFSTGNTEFQLAKISLLEDMLHKNHIHIFANKEENLLQLLEDYKDSSLILVDDFVTILDKVKKHNPSVFTIWMKRGKFAEKAIIPSDFKPDATIVKLDELIDLVDNN